MLLSLVRGDRNTRPIVDEESDSTSRVLSETAYHGHGHLPAYAEMKVPFLAIGPRVKVGRRIRAVSIYDLAPTIAHVLGLDLPGMKGRVLTEIFDEN